MAKLSTHVLDTAAGRPAAGMGLVLLRLGNTGHWEPVLCTRTNADGRCDRPLLEGDALVGGRYCLRFAVGEYFAGQRAATAGADATASQAPMPFLDQVPIEFGIANPEQSYHVPLLVSPWSYTTYRGS
ncbi:MAG: hydroxyisourate hydrolase [Betaproteobacteria bacterium]